MEGSGDRRGRLLALGLACGTESRALRIGAWDLALEGLDAAAAAGLDRRWGGFVRRGVATDPVARLALYRDVHGTALGPGRPGDAYRIEADSHDDRVVVSHAFSMCAENDDRTAWRLGVIDTQAEPTERTIENAVRYLIARACVGAGGFALHGAGVLRDGQAHVFAGPSRSGKTTAVGLATGGSSLGDDFAVVIRAPDGWRTAAVPFDNSERAPSEPPEGLFPVAAIWRLRQSSETRVDRLSVVEGTASLMGCAAFPWAMPDLAGAVLEHVGRFVSGAAFSHLYFTRTSNLWSAIDACRA